MITNQMREEFYREKTEAQLDALSILMLARKKIMELHDGRAAEWIEYIAHRIAVVNVRDLVMLEETEDESE
jgi:hypothetical protein